MPRPGHAHGPDGHLCLRHRRSPRTAVTAATAQHTVRHQSSLQPLTDVGVKLLVLGPVVLLRALLHLTAQGRRHRPPAHQVRHRGPRDQLQQPLRVAVSPLRGPDQKQHQFTGRRALRPPPQPQRHQAKRRTGMPLPQRDTQRHASTVQVAPAQGPGPHPVGAVGVRRIICRLSRERGTTARPTAARTVPEVCTAAARRHRDARRSARTAPAVTAHLAPARPQLSFSSAAWCGTDAADP
jgi:hypothetical protein